METIKLLSPIYLIDIESAPLPKKLEKTAVLWDESGPRSSAQGGRGPSRGLPFAMATSAPTSSTANAVLGLLSFGHELSGYDLKKWADHSLKFFFGSPAISQIYGELQRLESLGLVVSRIEDRSDARVRRLYTITEAGQVWLASWLETEPVELPSLRNPTILRVWLGHLMDPDALRDTVKEQRGQLEEQLSQLSEDRQRVPHEASMAYAELVIQWAERYYSAEVDNMDRLLNEIDALGHPRS